MTARQPWLMLLSGGLVFASAIGVEAAQAQSPFQLEYTVEAISADLFDYQFSLILDNGNGSWAPGQEFDWFVFGDVPSGQVPPLTDWQFDIARSDPALQVFTSSTGGHNGPTVGYGASVQLPGYIPIAIDDTLTWAGTSTSLAEVIAWSNLRFSGGATRANFVAAQRVEPEPKSIPEASAVVALWLTGAAMAITARKTMGR